MSEEIKKNEMNEDALETVSAGVGLMMHPYPPFEPCPKCGALAAYLDGDTIAQDAISASNKQARI